MKKKFLNCTEWDKVQFENLRLFLSTMDFHLDQIRHLTKQGIKQRTANSTYKKLAVQWLIEHLCFVSSSMLADSFRLRNRQQLLAAIR